MPDPALAGCYVISLRPVGQHAALRRAAAKHGARVLALSPWTLAPCDDASTRAALAAALACTRVLVTSPNAARAAAALQPLRIGRGQTWYAVGSGTAHALARAGVSGVLSPGSHNGARADRERAPRAGMDSEGLLALPGLQQVDGETIGLVTAPGGRGMIERVLLDRGARILRADVYARIAIELRPRAVAALRALDAPGWLALSSGEALGRLLARLPDDAVAVLRRARVAAASERLAQCAQAAGFTGIVVAASARPRDLVAAMAAQASASMRAMPNREGRLLE